MRPLFTLAIMIPSTLFHAWVTAKIWLWFIVTTFGLRPLLVIQAAGLVIVARWITFQWPRNTEEIVETDSQYCFRIFSNAFFVPLVFVAIAWGFAQFMPHGLEAAK